MMTHGFTNEIWFPLCQAGLLHYAKKITEAAADGAQVLDCVIVVPPFFGPAQRQAIIDAADLAGLKVMSLINSHAAAALQYGIERDFTNKTHLVVLYDIGATDTEVALIRYSSFTVKEYGKPKTYRYVAAGQGFKSTRKHSLCPAIVFFSFSSHS
jgi:molecular chaperone DnaK (HSP70)